MGLLSFFRKARPEPSGTRPRPRRTVSNKVNMTSSELSGGAKIHGGLPGTGEPIHRDNRQLVIDARNASHDSLECKTIVDRTSDIVVDTAIKLRATIDADALGISDDDAEKWNSRTSKMFHNYMLDRGCVRSQMYNGYSAQRLFMNAKMTDNDTYVRFYFEDEPDELSPVSFEFIDCLSIDGNGGFYTDGRFNYDDGITRDSRGREISYRVSRMLANGNYEYVDVPAKSGSRIMMWHGFVPTQISQVKGISQFSHMLQEFCDMGSFRKAHVDKAIAQAGLAITVYSDSDNAPISPLPTGDMTSPAGTRASDIYGSSTLTEAEIASIDDGLNIDVVNDFSRKTAGSMAVVMAGGKDKIQSIQNTAPVTGYDKFVDSFVSQLSASSGMGVEILLQKFNSNYSASRAALIMFYRKAEIERHKIDEDFITPIYKNWLAEEIALGRIKCPGWSDCIIRNAWLNHICVGASVPNIDPDKLAKANMKNLAMSATDLDRVAFETNGSNSRANRNANRRDFKTLEKPYFQPRFDEDEEESNEDDE